jgi:hypothetical protein
MTKTWEETVMGRAEIDEVKYLDVTSEPDTKELSPNNRRLFEDGAIAKRQAEITWHARDDEVKQLKDQIAKLESRLVESVSHNEAREALSEGEEKALRVVEWMLKNAEPRYFSGCTQTPANLSYYVINRPKELHSFLKGEFSPEVLKKLGIK